MSGQKVDGKSIEASPFIMGIMSPWQMACALKFGKRRPVVMDSTHGTNNLMVRD